VFTELTAFETARTLVGRSGAALEPGDGGPWGSVQAVSQAVHAANTCRFGFLIKGALQLLISRYG